MSKLQKIADTDYEIIDKGEEAFHHIVLNESSPFPSVVFQFGKVQLIEDTDNDCLRVKFEYEIFDNPMKLNTQAENFREYVGNILMTNLEELLFYNKYQRTKQE